MNKIISKYKLVITFVSLLVLDGLFFGLVNPDTVSQLVLLLGFLLVGFTIYVLIYLILRYLRYLGFKFRNVTRISLILTIVFIISLALESIGQFSTIDLITLLIFCLMLYVYLGAIAPKGRSK